MKIEEIIELPMAISLAVFQPDTSRISPQFSFQFFLCMSIKIEKTSHKYVSFITLFPLDILSPSLILGHRGDWGIDQSAFTEYYIHISAIRSGLQNHRKPTEGSRMLGFSVSPY